MSAAIAPLIEYGSLDEAYPDVDSEFSPAGSLVLFQLRTPKNKTKGGLILPQGTLDGSQHNTQVAKVIAVGPVAFKDRDTLKPWPEGAWCEVGDFVRVPLFGGDRWYLPVPGRSDYKALFAVYRDLDIKGQHRGDPLLVDPFM